MEQSDVLISPTSLDENTINYIKQLIRQEINEALSSNNLLYYSNVQDSTPDITNAPITYTITNNLSNCTTSNSTKTINKNSSYSAKIAAKSGYAIESVVVNMGGVDITSTSYSNGTISISNVTANITITVKATQQEVEYPSSENEFASLTWVNGYWKKTDNNATIASSTAYITNNFAAMLKNDYTFSVKESSEYTIGIRFYVCESFDGTTAVNVTNSKAYGTISGAVAKTVDFSVIKALNPNAKYFSFSIWAKAVSNGAALKQINKKYDEYWTITKK